jgi:hypothetical protein
VREWHHEHISDVLGRGQGFAELEDTRTLDDLETPEHTLPEAEAIIRAKLNAALDERASRQGSRAPQRGILCAH